MVQGTVLFFLNQTELLDGNYSCTKISTMKAHYQSAPNPYLSSTLGRGNYSKAY